MKPIPERVRAGRRTLIDAVIILIVVVLMTQMWLLTASLESYLAGHTEVALPGMLISGVLLLACFGLYRFVAHTDLQPEPEDRR
ncbi:MAG TPA: DUF6755 family protein [Bryobacteraceae bacterium]|nr:DUF6755 family protein [Bryobacteraceae bacterium]